MMARQPAIKQLIYREWVAQERAYVNKLRARKVMVLDECHGLEKQILGFFAR